MTSPRKSIAHRIWDEEQKVQELIVKGTESGTTPIHQLSHMNGILRGLRIARDIAESQELSYVELQMHYGEATEWIAALEAWIVRKGLEVPNWHNVKE